MKQILNELYQHKELTQAEAKEVLEGISAGKFNPAQIASFLTIFMMRSITVAELAGFREALLELCLITDLSEFDPIDLCGTGGDGKNTFNISTLASFVVAGAGIKVAKHGNYGVSSPCGSSNVLEFLGIQFSNDYDCLRKQIEESDICFLHAPLFHPAMKTVAPIRKELGVKTFFNMLGPLVNPAFPKKQITGVFSLELARRYAYLFQKMDHQFTIVHALDGYDEISLTGPFKLISNRGEQILDAEDLGFNYVGEADISGGKDVADSARIFMNILEGKGTKEQENVVIANAAIAISCGKETLQIDACLEQAKESLHSRKALNALRKLVKLSN